MRTLLTERGPFNAISPKPVPLSVASGDSSPQGEPWMRRLRADGGRSTADFAKLFYKLLPQTRSRAFGMDFEAEEGVASQEPFVGFKKTQRTYALKDAQRGQKKGAPIPLTWDESAKTLRGATQIQARDALLYLLLREGDRTRLRVRWWHCLRRSLVLRPSQPAKAEVSLCRWVFRLLMSRLGGGDEWNYATPKRLICQAIRGQRGRGRRWRRLSSPGRPGPDHGSASQRWPRWWRWGRSAGRTGG